MLDTNLVVRKSISGKLFILSLIRVIYFCKDSSKVSPSGGGEWLDLLVPSNLKLGALCTCSFT